MISCRTILSTLFAVMAALPAIAQSDSLGLGDDQSLRIDPKLTPREVVETRVADYEWLNLEANRVNLNGDDWSRIGQKVANIGSEALRIVVIGDSHIQADAATSVVRGMLQRRYGGAGRGLVTPLRLAGTNEPRDYRLTSSATRWQTSRLVPRRYERPMMFSGVTITPLDAFFDLTVSTTDSQFSELRLYYGGSEVPTVVSVGGEGGTLPEFTVDDSMTGVVDIKLTTRVDECRLNMRLPVGATTYIGGIELLSGDSGVEFSAIGNNGAAFMSYAGIGVGKAMARMKADIVIVALGTNDAWGTMSDTDFTRSVDNLVAELRRDCPEAKILLTTPMEAQKGSRRAVRAKGKKRRRATRVTYTPNVKVGHFRKLLLDYGRDSGVATYDFYSVAGGDGSSAKWIGSGLFSRDRVHLSWPGYDLMGRLSGEALIECLERVKPINIEDKNGDN